jgi:putative CocE/NonD family hydrolase
MKRFILVAAAMLSSVALAEDFSKYSEDALKQALEQVASVEKKVLVPMRDGAGLSTDIYLPKNPAGKLPTILWRTPYNFHKLSSRDSSAILHAVSRGYAFAMQNERGRYFSEGKFEILGYPRTDGHDALTWIAKQSWSNGKVGTWGCSSSAEWQLALAAQKHPAHAAMVPMSVGAGIGRVGRYHEQGNWYTGGVPRTLFFVWLYNVDNPLRAQIPAGLDRATRARIGEYNDLAALKPPVDWKTHIFHLPIATLLSDLKEPPATFDRFIRRKPNDPAWFEGGLYHDNEGWGVPALWFNSWYDVSIGPNLELFNHVREVAEPAAARQNQYAVIAPTSHCDFFKFKEQMKVGERDMGDVRFDTWGEVFRWFDRWLKNEPHAFPSSTPAVRYYTMGKNKWQAAEQWPPRAAKMTRLYLQSGGHANSLYGDGRLGWSVPKADEPVDQFTYDPLNPVLTIGGGDCCNGGLVVPGARDQRPVEARQDVLVYTSEVLDKPVEVSGFVDVVLSVSSTAKDTDFAVKLVDVAPDGTAYILHDTILRARYREGFDRELFMEQGRVYQLRFSPMVTSNLFEKGHRIRVEVTSSNFPKFVRNLNTGGNNFDEAKGVPALNAVHHSAEHLSYLELPILQ